MTVTHLSMTPLDAQYSIRVAWWLCWWLWWRWCWLLSLMTRSSMHSSSITCWKSWWCCFVVAWLRSSEAWSFASWRENDEEKSSVIIISCWWQECLMHQMPQFVHNQARQSIQFRANALQQPEYDLRRENDTLYSWTVTQRLKTASSQENCWTRDGKSNSNEKLPSLFMRSLMCLSISRQLRDKLHNDMRSWYARESNEIKCSHIHSHHPNGEEGDERILNLSRLVWSVLKPVLLQIIVKEVWEIVRH